MNQWAKKSIELVKEEGYLDKLSKIYPIKIQPEREIPIENEKKIRDAIKTKDYKKIINSLLELEKFPIDDPYISMIRKIPDIMSKNPETIKRIGETIITIGEDEILDLCRIPKSSSRQIGSMFRNFIHSLKYPLLDQEKFIKDTKGIAFLNGGDNTLKDFANTYLEFSLEKGIDFIAKVNKTYIIGEAKFLTSWGGTQTNQFKVARDLANLKEGKAIKVAILDGVVWLDKKSGMCLEVREMKGLALSAVLFENFLKSYL